MSRPRDRATERLNQVRSAVFASIASNRQPLLAAGSFLVSRSQRNPTPLFGLGLIDSIPDEAIVAVEKRQAKESPETQRTGQPPQGRSDRPAGLERPDRQRRRLRPECLCGRARSRGSRSSSGHDTASPEVSHGRARPDVRGVHGPGRLRAEPASAGRAPAVGVADGKHLDAGRATFASSRLCELPHAQRWAMSRGSIATCCSTTWVRRWATKVRMPKKPPTTMSRWFPGSFQTWPPTISPLQAPAPQLRGATRQEWRTPPLWGFRDSGPYLHDGRAQTLDEAVAMHGGQGAAAAHRFFELTPRERLQVEAFLKSLVAPPAVQLARNGD